MFTHYGVGRKSANDPFVVMRIGRMNDPEYWENTEVFLAQFCNFGNLRDNGGYVNTFRVYDDGRVVGRRLVAKAPLTRKTLREWSNTTTLLTKQLLR